ncbi:hypothetical protein [Spirillospora sp. NPDC047279]|uniref:hypothetical protein n=1 Tax=Spirillospora sp. NPDC047279 TaxID=3155478 RepID=UPI0033C59C87
MSLCLDVYVWVPEQSAETFERFINTYVNMDNPGDQRVHAFRRAYVLGTANEADDRALDELRPEGWDGAFTLYVRARDHHQAMIAITRDGATVLGLSIEAPDDQSETLRQAERLLRQLRHQFSAPAGLAGVELPPPWDLSDWHQQDLALLRVGEP